MEPDRQFKKSRQESADHASKENFSDMSIDRAKTQCFYMFLDSHVAVIQPTALSDKQVNFANEQTTEMRDNMSTYQPSQHQARRE